MERPVNRAKAKVYFAPHLGPGLDSDILGLSGYCEHANGAFEFSPTFTRVADAVAWGLERAATVLLRINNYGPWGQHYCWAGDGAAPSDAPALDLEAAEAELARVMSTGNTD